MRIHTIILASIILIFSSCEKGQDQLPLTPDLVTDIKAYDLDNNGNSSDIRVDFKVQNNLNVEEYRIMIVPAIHSTSLTLDNAISAPEQSFTRIAAIPFNLEYSIIRLSVGKLDVMGNPIIDNTEYKVKILVRGIGAFQLSTFSKSFTLVNRGIYSGEYLGYITYNNTSPVTRPISLSLNSASGDRYTGAAEVEINNLSFFIDFKVIGSVIEGVNFSEDVLNWIDGVSVGCGVFENELRLHITYNIGSCTADPVREILVVRQ